MLLLTLELPKMRPSVKTNKQKIQLSFVAHTYNHNRKLRQSCCCYSQPDAQNETMTGEKKKKKDLPILQIKTQQKAFRHCAFKQGVQVSLTPPPCCLRLRDGKTAELHHHGAIPQESGPGTVQRQARRTSPSVLREALSLRDRRINNRLLAWKETHTRLDPRT